MTDYPLPQAAARAGMDERSFRLLADRRIINATPRTRTQGRGKQKLYETDEILIAAILAPLVKIGADSFSLGGAADWLRTQIGSREFERARAGKPVYVRLRYRGAEDWGIELNEARSLAIGCDENDASVHYLPVHEPGPTNTLWSSDFMVVKLDERIHRAEETTNGTFGLWRNANAKPSDCLVFLEHPPTTNIYTPQQIDEMRHLLESLVAAGDTWSDTSPN